MSDGDASLQKILDDLQAERAVEENFRLLCDRFHRPVYAFFSKRGFSHADCLDLIQETFLGIYRGIGSFRRDARFETWLFKVATNAMRKRLRHETADKRAGEEVSLDTSLGEEEERPAVEPVAAGPSPEASMLQDEQARRLREEIDGLPDQMRKCLVLQVYHEFKEREIAQLLHLAPGTVKAHIFQAKQRLRKKLGDQGAPPRPGEAPT